MQHSLPIRGFSERHVTVFAEKANWKEINHIGSCKSLLANSLSLGARRNDTVYFIDLGAN